MPGAAARSGALVLKNGSIRQRQSGIKANRRPISHTRTGTTQRNAPICAPIEHDQVVSKIRALSCCRSIAMHGVHDHVPRAVSRAERRLGERLSRAFCAVWQSRSPSPPRAGPPYVYASTSFGRPSSFVCYGGDREAPRSGALRLDHLHNWHNAARRAHVIEDHAHNAAVRALARSTLAYNRTRPTRPRPGG